MLLVVTEFVFYIFHIWLKVKGVETKCWPSHHEQRQQSFTFLQFCMATTSNFSTTFSRLSLFPNFFFFQTQLQPPTTPAQAENAGLKPCNFSPSVSFPIIVGDCIRI